VVDLQLLLAVAGERKPQRVAGVDAVRVLDLGVHVPDLGPQPGILQEQVGEAPERVALLDHVALRGTGGDRGAGILQDHRRLERRLGGDRGRLLGQVRQVGGDRLRLTRLDRIGRARGGGLHHGRLGRAVAEVRQPGTAAQHDGGQGNRGQGDGGRRAGDL